MFKTLFLSVNDKDKDYINKKYAQEIQELRVQMDRYVEHKIAFVHPKDMERCAQEVEFKGDWEAIPFGDPEWIWVLNRHRFIEELARVYYLTNDVKYLNSMVDYLEDWIDKNPDSNNRNMTSWRRIDTGIRLCRWIKALELVNFRVPASLIEKIKKSYLEQGTYLAQSVSGFSQTSNWGVLEFHGLFHLSLCYNHDLSEKWLELSKNFLINSIETQVLPDGNHWECSPMYHNEVCLCYLNFVATCKRHQIELPQQFKDRVHQMALCNVIWQKPDYTQPLWGDSDATDVRDINTLAAYLFSDSTLKNRGFEECDFENYFLFGEQGNKAYQAILSCEPEFKSYHLEDSGFLCLRDSWKEDSSFLTFNTKKFGAGHNHDDLLHVSYYARQKDYLIDCGRYTYVESEERKNLKSSFGHNTIILNNQENSKYINSWENGKEALSIPGEYKNQEGMDWAYAHNLSYLHEKSFITRNLIRLDSQNFLLVDSIMGEVEKNIELKFNTPCDIQKTGGNYLFDDLLFIPDPRMNVQIKEAYYSLNYNEKSPGKQSVCTVNTNKNIALISGFSFDEMKISAIDLYTRLDRPIPQDQAIAWRINVKDQEYILLYRLGSEIGNSTRFIKFQENEYFIYAKTLLKKEASGYRKIIKFPG